MDPVARLGVVGCGLMGSGVAEVAVRHGIDVRVAEATPDAVEAVAVVFTMPETPGPGAGPDSSSVGR